MKATHNITIDIIRRSVTPTLHAMQFDALSRVVAVELLANGEAYTPPAGVTFALSYKKPDGTRGFYDQLPDGTAAVSASGNILSVTLAPQVLTCPGTVQASLVMQLGDDRLSAFPFAIRVEADPGAGTETSEGYYRAAWLPMPANAAPGQFFRIKAVDANGRVTAVEAVDINAETPDTYLYNSLRLPDIYKVYTPQLQAQYPGAFLLEYEADILGAHYRSATLYLVPKVEYTKADNGNWCVSLENGYKTSNIQVSLTGEATDADYAGTQWGPLEDKTGVGIVASEIDWANFDVLNEDGTVCLAASSPVPAYSGDTAVRYTEQTLTPEQQTRARENIGAGSKPVVIDLDTYGDETQSISDVLKNLFFGDELTDSREGVALGSLFADLNTDSPIRVKFSILNAMLSVDGVTVAYIDGEQEALSFSAVIFTNGVLIFVSVAITADGMVVMHKEPLG